MKTALDVQWTHYSQERLTWLDRRTYRRSGPGKPFGFWLSDDSDLGWAQWWRDNSWDDELGFIRHVVELAPDANILTLTTADEVRALHPASKGFSVDWSDIVASYDGIAITPYQWACRLPVDWYYCWDVASACIWNLDAIASIRPQEAAS